LGESGLYFLFSAGIFGVMMHALLDWRAAGIFYHEVHEGREEKGRNNEE